MQRSAGEPTPPVGTVSLGLSLSSSPEVASAHASPVSWRAQSLPRLCFNHIFTAKELSQNHSEGFDLNDTACACKTSPLPA